VNECLDAKALMGAQLLGGLDEEEERTLFAHLAQCESCAAKHARLAPLVPLIDRAGPIERVLDRPRPRSRRLAIGRAVPVLGGALGGAAATLAVVALLGGLGGSSPAPPAPLTLRLSPTLQAPTAAATAYVIEQHGATTIALEARGLPIPRPGERYIVWLSGNYGSWSVGRIDVNDSGWGTAILRSPHALWHGARISILATPAHSMSGKTRLLVRGTL
jgi:hypothetical protein